MVWRQEDWDSYKFVRALKGEQLNKYCHVPVDGVPRRLSNQNLGSAITWFSEFAAAYLKKKGTRPPFIVVPIPNHKCTVGSPTRPYTRKIAEGVCQAVGSGAQMVDCLRWKKDLGSAREGGPRDPETLYRNLSITQRIQEKCKVILVDDVLTSGGHARACAAKLRDASAHIERLVCGGRTTYSQDRGAFAVVEEELSDYTPSKK